MPTFEPTPEVTTDVPMPRIVGCAKAPALSKRSAGVTFVMGSALNAGFLGGAPRYNYGEDNTLIAEDKRRRLATLREVAHAHGVDLVAAALRFSLAPDVAASLIVGTASPAHLLADHAAMRAKIPADFWGDLRAQGILHPDAPLPA